MIENEKIIPFWSKIKKDSNNYETPVILKKNDMFPVFSSRDIISIFKGFSTINSIETFPLRVFVNNNQENLYYKDIIHKNPPNYNQDILNWIGNIFGENKFCIIINTCEAISENISIKVANFFHPLYKQFGSPYFKMQTNLIIGNYDYTPLGIHIDYPNQRVIHFQMGNAKKIMHVWSNNELINLIGHKLNNYKDIENFREYKKISKKYTLENGDLFLLPSGKYHLGEILDNKISISLNVAVHKQTQSDILDYVLKVYKNYTLSKITDTDINSFLPDKFNINIVQEGLLKKSLTDYQYFLESNLGFESIPLSKEEEVKIKKIDSIKFVSLIKPYKIIIQRGIKNKYVMHTRGRTIITPKSKSILSLSETLNKSTKVSIQSVIDIMKDDFSKDDIYYILILLYKNRMIYINK